MGFALVNCFALVHIKFYILLLKILILLGHILSLCVLGLMYHNAEKNSLQKFSFRQFFNFQSLAILKILHSNGIYVFSSNYRSIVTLKACNLPREPIKISLS